MGKNDKWIITRVYECKSCESVVAFEESASKAFRKRCPVCNKHALLLKEGISNLSIFVDSTRPKTLGALAEKNTEDKLKRGESIEDPLRKKPFWRKSNKINYKVLSNPGKYVQTGKI